jgi:histidinol dehydrogenase
MLNDARTLRAFGRPLSVRQAVEVICRDVRTQGDKALIKYVRRLEGAALSPAKLKLTPAERAAAEKRLTRQERRALLECARHIRAFHEAQKPRQAAVVNRPGVRVAERCRPLRRAGIYVPGGNAPLVSTVLMNALPAAVAGVAEIIMTTPAQPDGSIADALVAAANLAGVKTIFRLGGAVAVAALAYGTQTVPRVDKIVGPGSMFVTEATRQVAGDVGIDQLAGPSEILIVADDSAEPETLAWDLLGQCEHGSGAVSMLLTPSRLLLQQVQATLAEIGRREAGWLKTGEGITLVQTASLAQAVQLANEYGAEHLSLQCRRAQAHLEKIINAGAVFIGAATPQALGDYTAGPNHVLPTGGTCRWASPLSVRDFLHYTSLVAYTQAGVKREGTAAVVIAEAEGLTAHAQSIRARMRG